MTMSTTLKTIIELKKDVMTQTMSITAPTLTYKTTAGTQRKEVTTTMAVRINDKEKDNKITEIQEGKG